MTDDLERLSAMSASELTSALLGVMRERSGAVDLHRAKMQQVEDRFSRVSRADPAVIRAVENALAETFPPNAEEVALSPLAPFGLHHAVAAVDQHRVVSTIRRTEVAADPTVILAVEAAQRRRALIDADGTDATTVTLAAFQRVTRAQHFGHPDSFAHFRISGLVSAGRDTGALSFERDALHSHVGHIVDGLLAVGCEAIGVRISDFAEGTFADVIAEVIDRWSSERASIVSWPERTRARGYYNGLAIEVHVTIGDERIEIGDGGSTDWTQRLVPSRKERCFISGLGIERLVMALTRSS